MIFGEIIIGPPGSGKTTYIMKKKDQLTRKIVTINLDPGNELEIFEYNIREFYQTDEFALKNEYGPNNAVKEILTLFTNNLNDHLSFIEDEDSYYIFDFPGQVEFFMVGDSLKKIFDFLIKKGVSLTVINLFDLVHFTTINSTASAYLIATLCFLFLEVPQVCVISKCDNNNKFKVDLDKVMNLEALKNENEFIQQVYEFVHNNSVLSFEMLDINNKDSIIYLQYVIDCCNGYLYNNEEKINEEYKDIKEKDSILEKYINN
ncbi:ATP-binding protein [Tubulinosema ratisbonensis]|uniref:GPN-loop GTPase 2 n=1 Tax=Tubulinosema ratisbonensis TaxID=291195 RepID=A0A437AHK0_9MICR|nr:ATP-binding protein [Tubulinosema ratisbonensis]